MKSPAPAARSGVGFNMTPMIDIVFQLIIFFLVASHLARQEANVPVDLPSAATGSLPSEDQRQRRLTLSVRADGELHLAGRTVALEQVEAALAAEVVRIGPDLEVRIRCDRAAPYALVEPLLLACARHGVWRVRFAVVHAAS